VVHPHLRLRHTISEAISDSLIKLIAGFYGFLVALSPRTGVVILRQTFVRRSHGDNYHPGRSTMSNGISSALNSTQDLASIPMARRLLIGGDRDGNPYVIAEVLRKAVGRPLSHTGATACMIGKRK
jgi:hypothetical protein